MKCKEHLHDKHKRIEVLVTLLRSVHTYCPCIYCNAILHYAHFLYQTCLQFPLQWRVLLHCLNAQSNVRTELPAPESLTVWWPELSILSCIFAVFFVFLQNMHLCIMILDMTAFMTLLFHVTSVTHLLAKISKRRKAKTHARSCCTTLSMKTNHRSSCP